MSFKLLAPLKTCLGLERRSQKQVYVEKPSYEPKYSDSGPDNDDEIESSASRFVSILLEADNADPTDPQLRAALKGSISTCGYYDRVAEWILKKLDDALRSGATLGKAVKEASGRAIEAAVGFAKEHPAYCTLIALGILVMMAPWVLEVLGFAELGPVAGKSRYHDFSLKTS